MPNPFVHVELHTTEPIRAKQFYGALFGWKLTDVELASGTYTMIDVGNGTGGGMLMQTIAGARSTWLPYVRVTNAKAATMQARALGAIIVREVVEVPDMGWLAIVEDPTGATFGLWEPEVA